MEIRPEILTHPNIPKPLHGLAPRVIFGAKWWNEQRQLAYAKNDYHCMACGVHKSKAKYHQWLEAHENYNIDYKNFTAEIKEITPLCHSCHNFIHSGRLLKLFLDGTIDYNRAFYILDSRMKLLEKNNLKPFFGSRYAYYKLKYIGLTNHDIYNKLIDDGYTMDNLTADADYDKNWSKWKLILNGKAYYSLYENYENWSKNIKKS